MSLIKAALDTHGGQVGPAADELGIPKKTLYDKMKKIQRFGSTIPLPAGLPGRAVGPG